MRADAGKYDKDTLPEGPRSALFRQILPGARPLLQVMQEVAEARGKTVPQVDSVFVTLHMLITMILFACLVAAVCASSDGTAILMLVVIQISYVCKRVALA